jgi:hypothetical protein
MSFLGDIWDGFKQGTKHNWDDTWEVGGDLVQKGGDVIAGGLGLKLTDDEKNETTGTDWVLYSLAGLSVLTLVAVIFFKFVR